MTTNDRSLCKLRHKNGNCLCVGGFCTAVNDEICKSIRMSYEKGYVDGKKDTFFQGWAWNSSNVTQHTGCVETAMDEVE